MIRVGVTFRDRLVRNFNGASKRSPLMRIFRMVLSARACQLQLRFLLRKRDFSRAHRATSNIRVTDGVLIRAECIFAELHGDARNKKLGPRGEHTAVAVGVADAVPFAYNTKERSLYSLCERGRERKQEREREMCSSLRRRASECRVIE